MFPTKEEVYAALAARHGTAMQAKLSAAAVAVCGLGGLGSNVAVHLARAGVGRLYLIDFDTVDLANLNRQQYFPDQLGQPKADALMQTVRRIAPYCDVTAESVRLTAENIPEKLAAFPIVCECFDRADQKAMLVNCVLEQMPETDLIAASGMAGIGSANTIRTRRLAPHFYLSGDGVSDSASAGGLFSARVAVCAAHQANTVIRIIAGERDA